MRSVFPAYFRPTADGYKDIWNSCVFAVDANVLLNLYRYSPETRKELETALSSIKERIFVPHQAAKEFLKNRFGVTAGQAEEYTKATKTISELISTISNKKKHPFLGEGQLEPFVKSMKDVLAQLEGQREALLNRLTNDEILDFVESLFEGRTGAPLTEEELKALQVEGEVRYQQEIPPGYKDGKKDSSGDPYRKFGDLIVWKQIMAWGKNASVPVVFITDDQKEDWWLEQSGRTIGPRTELREEFLREVSKDFWMYTVDKFIEETAKNRKARVSQQVIAEIVEVREEARTERAARRFAPRYIQISREELLERLANSERWAAENGIPFLGLVSYVKSYLGNAGFDYDASFELIKELEKEGVIELYDHKGPGHEHSVTAIRLVRPDRFTNRPMEGLRSLMQSADQARSE